jgi:hypothetical protein
LLDSYVDTGDTEGKDPLSPSPLTYYIDPKRCSHIDKWVYSPPTAIKRVESVFAPAGQ